MYSYSNFGFAVLGAVLEFIHDESYGTLLQKLTLRLGCPGIRLPSGKDQEVAGYGAKGAPVQPWKFDVFAPVGAATATLPDLISFVQRCMAPIEEPGLIETMSERMTFSTRPPFGSGLPQTAVGASTAAIATIVSPQSYYVPLYACGVAALFGGGASGGLIATAAWTAASIYNRAPIDVVGQRIGFGLLATGIAVLSTSAKRKRTMGLGWHVTQLDTRDIIWHNGGTAGFRSFLGIDSERGKASIVLSARAQSVDAVGLSLLR
jgi:CubicO group peptidase (beta-lactamase class C family)